MSADLGAESVGGGGLLLRRLPKLSYAWLLTLVLGGFIVVDARWGPDWPAQLFRASAVHASLLVTWTDQWYGGQPMAGYSLLYPLGGHLLGAGMTGLLAATVSAWAIGHLAPDGDTAARRWYEALAAIPLCASLLIGQVPFLLGTAFAVLAFWALKRRHRVVCAALALCAALASPLAGAFVLLVGVALAVGEGWRRGAPLVAAGLGVAVCTFAGGASGRFPCPWTSAGAVILFGALVWIFTTRHDRFLRAFAVCYAAAAVACFFVPDPIGGNVTRLGKLLAVPLLGYFVLPARGRGTLLDRLRRLGRAALRGEARACLAAITAAVAVVWSVQPAYDGVTRGSVDPSRNATYYAGLLGFLASQDPAHGRLEIPFTRGHWEATYVAQDFPLARGWERQSDLKYNAALYEPDLTASGYRDWLTAMDVALVALPDAAIDYGGRQEAALLQQPPAYLQPVWHDAHWQVWRVAGASPMVTGPAQLRELEAASLTLAFSAPGTATVRIHDSALWSIADGDACLEPSRPDNWMRVYSSHAGPVSLAAHVGLPSTRDACGS